MCVVIWYQCTQVQRPPPLQSIVLTPDSYIISVECLPLISSFTICSKVPKQSGTTFLYSLPMPSRKARLDPQRGPKHYPYRSYNAREVQRLSSRDVQRRTWQGGVRKMSRGPLQQQRRVLVFLRMRIVPGRNAWEQSRSNHRHVHGIVPARKVQQRGDAAMPLLREGAVPAEE